MSQSGPSYSAATEAADPRDRSFFGHPSGLAVLFSTELWERFSFYSMRAFLVLYMTKALSLSKQAGNEVYGGYLGFVYAAPFVGGMLADRLLGQRRAIVIGGIMMAAAQFCLAAHALLLPAEGGEAPVYLNQLFFLSLGLMAAGNGFFKPNISSIVGSLYEKADARRDSAFTIFYMGINIGAWVAGISGQVAESKGWHWGFILAGVGMLLGQVIFFAGGRRLEGKGLPPREGALLERGIAGLPNVMSLIIGVMIFIPTTAYLISQPKFVQSLAIIVAVPILIYLLWEAFRSSHEERDRMIVLIILCCFSILFWAFFELAGSAILLFTDEHVNRTVPWFGELKASLLTASINPAFIILFAAPFAWLWIWLNKRKMEPSSPLKFAMGLIQLAAGFMVLYWGAIVAGPDGRCNILFLVIGFMLHTTGELCLSPVGLSTMTKLAPARMVSTVMGVWFLSSALGNVLGGYVGGKTEHFGFAKVFLGIGIVTAASALLLTIVAAPLKRMMHGVK
ncbi:MAG: oligopeptide:H+ symporter [Phycisphaerae bacterium]|nr:oligopeptide:H+ symporter [Phycisphaerae bacterium]